MQLEAVRAPDARDHVAALTPACLTMVRVRRRVAASGWVCVVNSMTRCALNWRGRPPREAFFSNPWSPRLRQRITRRRTRGAPASRSCAITRSVKPVVAVDLILVCTTQRLFVRLDLSQRSKVSRSSWQIAPLPCCRQSCHPLKLKLSVLMEHLHKVSIFVNHHF